MTDSNKKNEKHKHFGEDTSYSYCSLIAISTILLFILFYTAFGV